MKTFLTVLTTICSVASAVLLTSPAHSATGTEAQAWAFGWGPRTPSAALAGELAGLGGECFRATHDDYGHPIHTPLSLTIREHVSECASRVLSHSENEFDAGINREDFIRAKNMAEEALGILQANIATDVVLR